jgi:alpha-L-fucosidase
MSRAVPTREQLEWADCELGAIFHYDITVFEQDYRFRRSWGYQPSPQIFAPDALDTDQWIRAVAKAGVRYAVLVAKHCTGFALFPSSANPYHVGNSPYGEDIVKSFVESCKKYGIRPGVYYSTVCNAYENVDNPGLVRTQDAGDQKHYNKVVETQLTELWSRYGEWFEIWFDGGTLSVEKGGLPIAPLLLRYQPNAITFQGDKLKKKNNLRWVGNEKGEAPFNCYSTTNDQSQSEGTIQDAALGRGNRNGTEWKPAECDMPIRKDNEWFYIDGHDKKVMSADQLFDTYTKTVGRNCNLLLGVVIDRHGRVPEADAKVLAQLGQKIDDRFSTPIASAQGEADGLTLTFPAYQKVDTVVLEEDVANGHSIFGFAVEAHTKKGWKQVFAAETIGHKRIARFRAAYADGIRLRVTDGRQGAQLRGFQAYWLDCYSLAQKSRILWSGHL